MRWHVFAALGLVGWRQRARGRSTHTDRTTRTAAQAARGWVSRSSNDFAKKENSGSSGTNFWLGFEACEEKGVIQKNQHTHSKSLSSAALLAVFSICYCTSEPLFCFVSCLKAGQPPPPPSLNLSACARCSLCDDDGMQRARASGSRSNRVHDMPVPRRDGVAPLPRLRRLRKLCARAWLGVCLGSKQRA